MDLTALIMFIIKLLIIFGAVYLIIKSLKFIILIVALIVLFFALQGVFDYNAMEIIHQIFSFNSTIIK